MKTATTDSREVRILTTVQLPEVELDYTVADMWAVIRKSLRRAWRKGVRRVLLGVLDVCDSIEAHPRHWLAAATSLPVMGAAAWSANSGSLLADTASAVTFIVWSTSCLVGWALSQGREAEGQKGGEA